MELLIHIFPLIFLVFVYFKVHYIILKFCRFKHKYPEYSFFSNVINSRSANVYISVDTDLFIRNMLKYSSVEYKDKVLHISTCTCNFELRVNKNKIELYHVDFSTSVLIENISAEAKKCIKNAQKKLTRS